MVILLSTRETTGSDIWIMCLADKPMVRGYHLTDYDWTLLNQNPAQICDDTDAIDYYIYIWRTEIIRNYIIERAKSPPQIEKTLKLTSFMDKIDVKLKNCPIYDVKLIVNAVRWPCPDIKALLQLSFLSTML